MKLLHPCLFALLLSIPIGSFAQAKKQKSSKAEAVFSWNNPPKKWTLKELPANLKHVSFKSPSMGIKVGYYVYLPKEYDLAKYKSRKFPVVYHLHGGRPGLVRGARRSSCNARALAAG